MRQLASIALTAALVLAPAGAHAQAGPAQDTEPAPTRPDWALFGVGTGMLALGWITNVIGGALAGRCPPSIPTGPGAGCSDQPEWEGFRVAGAVPLVGPWIQLAAKPTSFDQDAWAAWLIPNALVQTAGLVMLIAGLVARVERRPRAVALAPWVAPDVLGLSIAGEL